jgi:transketolase
MKATRNAYGEWLVENGADKDIVVVDADLAGSTKTALFAEEFKERFFDVGIAEQNLVAFAAGLALGGKKVFASSFAYFETGRAWDQIRNVVAHDNLNVSMVASHGGLHCASDGASHQAIEDLAIMRVIPNMTIIIPCDAQETKHALDATIDHLGPIYMRLRRENEAILEKKYIFKIGEAPTMKKGDDISIISTGSMVYYSLEAAKLLKKKGIDAEVINVHTLKPLDERAIINTAKKTGAVLTVEQHQLNGGLGGAVSEVLSENHPTLVKRMGVEDTFGETARKYEEILAHHNLLPEDIFSTAQELYEKSRK